MGDLGKLAAECRECAETYEKSPGLAGYGANSGTIADLYRTIARLADTCEPTAAPAPEAGGDAQKGRCYECGRAYGDSFGFPDLIVPDDVWRKISPKGDEGGLLCPSCMCSRAASLGLINVPARFASGPFAFPSAGAEAMREAAARLVEGLSLLSDMPRDLAVMKDAAARIRALPTAPTESQSAQAAVEVERAIIEAQTRQYASYYPVGSDGRNTFLILADWIAERTRRAALPPSGETGEEK